MNMMYKVNCLAMILVWFLVSCGPPASPEPVGPAGSESPAAPSGPVTTERSSSVEPGQFQSVAVVLVVDNFTKLNEEKPSSGHCTVTPDGQGLYGGRGAAMTILGEPHGKFVYTDFMNEISLKGELAPVQVDGEDTEYDGTTSFSGLPWIVRYDLFQSIESPEKALLTMAVDIEGFSIDKIARNIPQAIDLVAQNSLSLGQYVVPATTKIVVNMSFVLIPCDPESTMGIPVEELRNKYYNQDDRTFHDAVNSFEPLNKVKTGLENLYSGDVLGPLSENLKNYGIDISSELSLSGDEKIALVDDAVFQAYVTYLLYDDRQSDFPAPYPDLLREEYDPDANPPYLQWRQDENGLYSSLLSTFNIYAGQVIYVGAAGNFGGQFPLAPASWDFVDSISSQASDLHPQISLTATRTLAKYSNWGEIRMDGDFAIDPKEIYGTSFAAPKFSYRIAHSLLLENLSSPCSNSSPALGYAMEKYRPFKDSSGIAIPNDNNLSFDEALAYCSACVNNSDFVADVTMPDNTQVAAGDSFTKTWQLRNSGECAWDSNYRFVFVGGDQMSGPSSVPIPSMVSPGATIDISVALVAPTTGGTYRGEWRIAAPDGTLFGATPFVQIIVP